MSSWGFFNFTIAVCFFLFFFLQPSLATTQYIGQITPGFEASQSDWTAHNGVFLLSNNSAFGFGFYTSVDSSFFVLVVLHLYSQKVIWTANRLSLISASGKFVFDRHGNAYLRDGSTVAFSTNTEGGKAKAMKLEDSGNLVLLGESGRVLWQSFSHPTDTLISGQRLSEGMKLISFPNKNLSMHLQMESGDLILSAAYETPQVYWSMSKDTRKTIKQGGVKVSFASMEANSWNFYDKTGALAWQFKISEQFDPSALWTAVLGPDGSIQFYNLQDQSVTAKSTRIPGNPCNSPNSCAPFEVCFNINFCKCPSDLSSLPFCKPKDKPTCSNNSNRSVKLQVVGERMDYSALAYVTPQKNTSLDGCKKACLGNCSCTALFFDNSSDSCFLFDRIGSLQRPDQNSKGYFLAIKVPKDDWLQGNDSKGMSSIVIVITVASAMIVSGVAGHGIWYYYWRRKKIPSEEASEDNSEEEAEEDFEGLSGMPVRYSYNNLKNVTKDFSIKLGKGGFGSVYMGVQEDGSRLAVKKLEGMGQGKKEFRAEVNIIGSIHHVHLVKLKGFCAEGPHRLLVYEYMANGSLDRWIFKNDQQQGVMLDWETRYRIALGTARGLAYLHEECDWKIVHCDIKPENVLLDDHFVANVSDFGLAKLMSREQSQVMTTLRGTRGYLAPEWITNSAISEKSDVYSYGMLLLEVVGGRKNFDAEISSEKVYLPSYAFKMMEEGKLKEILDSRLNCDELDDVKVVTAIKVALWCIQDDVAMRPPMTKVVQMLEGLCPVLDPPVSCQRACRIYLGLVRPVTGSEDTNFSSAWTPEITNDRETMPSAERLSGPR